VFGCGAQAQARKQRHRMGGTVILIHLDHRPSDLDQHVSLNGGISNAATEKYLQALVYTRGLINIDAIEDDQTDQDMTKRQ
jgi:hypothetical protein